MADDRNFKADRNREMSRPEKVEGLLERQLPQAIDAERGVLGSLLLLPEKFDEVALILRHGDFYDDANARIYKHLVEMHDTGKQIDAMLLVQHLRDAGDYDLVGGAAYIAELGEAVPTAAHAEYYAKIVHEKATLRSLIHASTDIIRDSYDPTIPPREMLSRAEERVFSILEEKGGAQINSLRDVLQEALERLDARMRGQVAGMETGFIDFDDMTGGLQNSELIILAARPSMGKTSLAMNMVEHIAIDREQPTLFVSLEMSKLELGDRILCSRAKVNGHNLRNGHIGTEDSKRLIRTANEVSAAPLYIDDSPTRTMTEIAAAARRLKRRHGLSLIAIDYLQLIQPDNSSDPRQEQVSKIARRLKGLARELDIPVLCLAQLNRQVEATGQKHPQLSHLRESGAIEQDADVVMFIHRDEQYESTDEDKERVRGQADLFVRKQRNGPTGQVKLTWRHEFTRFENATPDPHPEFAGYGAAEGEYFE